jgi:hypothetical protein
MPTEEEVLKEIFEKATGKVARLLDAMLKLNVAADAEIMSVNVFTIVAASHHGNIDGSRLQLCDQCGAEVWIGPGSQRKIDARGSLPTRIICIPCFSEDILKEEMKDA